MVHAGRECVLVHSTRSMRKSFFLNTAGLKIVEPSTAYDAKGLIKAAIRDPDPVLYFEHKKLYRLPRLREELPSDDYIVEIGKARVARAGRDLSIITFGAMVLTALDAAEELEKEGLDVEVIDLRTLAPLDKPAILASVKKTSKAIVLHEASRTGGIGGEITAIIAEEAFEWLDAPVIRVASIDTPVPYSPPLEDYYLPQTKDVVEQRASWRHIEPRILRMNTGEEMSTEVVMPQMGESIAEGTITKWLKKLGERVERDEPLFEISTDKVDAEIPSPAAGTLTEVRFKEGDTVEVNTVVAVLDGDQAAATAEAPAAKPVEEPPANS